MKRWVVAYWRRSRCLAAACTAGGGDDAPSVIDTGSDASHEPVTLEIWGAWTGRELEQFNKIFDGFTEQVPMDHRREQGRRRRPEDPRRDQRRQPARRGAVVHARQRGPVLRVGGLAGPEPVHRAERLRRRRQFPPSRRGLHELRRQPVRVPVPHRRVRAVLQHRHVRGGGHLRAADDARRSCRRTRRSSRSSTPTARSRSPGSCPWLGYYEFSIAEPRATSSARPGTTTTDRNRWSPPTRRGRRCSSGSTTSSPTSTVTATSRPAPTGCERFVAGAGDEFSSGARLPAGRIAMNIDGEWRTAFIADEDAGPALRDGAVPAARRPGRPVRTRPDRRDDHRHAQGRAASGRGVAAAPVHGDGHGHAGLHGQQRPQRAHDPGEPWSRRSWT